MEGQTAPLVWRIIPYPLFVTRADKGLRGEAARGWEGRWHTHIHTPIHTHAYIIYSERDINPSFRAGDSAKGNRSFSIADKQTRTCTQAHTPASAVQRGSWAFRVVDGALWMTVQFHRFIWFTFGFCCHPGYISACAYSCYCVWMTGGNRNHKFKCSNVTYCTL